MKTETELVATKKDLVIAHDGLDERDRLRAENESSCKVLRQDAEHNAARAEMAEASAKLWEADALRYAKNAEYWQSRAEKAETALADHITALEISDRSADEQMRYKREAEKLWKEFITLLEITEESDSGYKFNPNKISSCRAMDGKRLNEILVEARRIVF